MTNVVTMRAPFQMGERKIFEQIQSITEGLTGDISVYDYLHARGQAIEEIQALLQKLQGIHQTPTQHEDEQQQRA